jgi:hypothetical protein
MLLGPQKTATDGRADSRIPEDVSERVRGVGCRIALAWFALHGQVMANVKLVSDQIDLPDGSYNGVWSAYTITVGESLSPVRTLETVDGVRSLDGIQVRVDVAGGRALVPEPVF